jgi:hypothetical protein
MGRTETMTDRESFLFVLADRGQMTIHEAADELRKSRELASGDGSPECLIGLEIGALRLSIGGPIVVPGDLTEHQRRFLAAWDAGKYADRRPDGEDEFYAIPWKLSDKGRALLDEERLPASIDG